MAYNATISPLPQLTSNLNCGSSEIASDLRYIQYEAPLVDRLLTLPNSGVTQHITTGTTCLLIQHEQLRNCIQKRFAGQRHCCLRLVTSLLFTTCYVIVVYDLLRHYYRQLSNVILFLSIISMQTVSPFVCN